MKCQSSLLLASTLCFAGTSAFAQTPPAVNQADAVKRQKELEQQLLQATKPGGVEMEAPELFQGELKDVGPQSILKVSRPLTRFEAVMDSQFFYTSNQNLTEDATGTTLFGSSPGGNMNRNRNRNSNTGAAMNLLGANAILE